MDEKEMLEPISKSILKLRNRQEVSNYLRDLFTKAEIKILTLRFQIATMLNEGISYVEIERATGASSATIAKVSESIKYGNDGLRVVLERMKRAN